MRADIDIRTDVEADLRCSPDVDETDIAAGRHRVLRTSKTS
jgi:hypothetical protein